MSISDDKTKAQFKQRKEKKNIILCMHAIKTQKKDEDEEGK